MKIVKAEVFVTCPGRNFVTLKITTEDGITGLGDATLNGRELSVASYLQDHLCLLLTTSGEVVSFLFRITKKEIYMTKEEFVSYIFDKTVEMYAATYGSCNPLNKPEGKDDFDKIYRFLEDRYIKRLEDAGIKSPVKSPLS